MKFTLKINSFHIALISLFLFLSSPIQGQYSSFLSTHIYQPEYYNPAAIGGGQVGLIHRRQWTGFDNAPISSNLFADFSSLLPFSNRVGIGLNLHTDKSHIFNQTNIDLSFAYHLLNNVNHRFSLGAIVGVLNQRIDFSDLKNINDIALYSGSNTKMIFSGGPGMFYSFQNGVSKLSIDVALPQLFASDFNYDEIDQVYQNQFNLIAGIRYHYHDLPVGLEPMILFRGVNGVDATLPKNTIDVNLRAYFLDDLFWLSGGTRLNGNTLLGGVGVTFNEKISVHGIGEYHNELGLTYEFGAAFKFGEMDKRNTIPSHVLEKLTGEKENIAIAKKKLSSSQFYKIRQYIQESKKNFNQANLRGLSTAEMERIIEQADNSMSGANTALVQLLKDSKEVLQAKWNADRIVREAKKDRLKMEEINVIHNAIIEDNEIVEEEIQKINLEYINHNKEITSFKRNNRIGIDIITAIKNKNQLNLEQALRFDLFTIPSSNLNPDVQVIPSDNLFEIQYKISYNENNYLLYDGIGSHSLIVNHIADQLNYLKIRNIKIEMVKLEMALQDGISDIRTINTGYPYLGEYGPISPNVITYNTQTQDRASKSIQINPGKKTTILDLSILKMYDIKRALRKKVNISNIFSDIEISGPNYEEKNSQTVIIKIFIQP